MTEESGCVSPASGMALTTTRLIPQVISRITILLPKYGQICCKNVNDLFDDAADKCIGVKLYLPSLYTYLLDLKSLMRQFKLTAEENRETDGAESAAKSVENYQNFLLDIIEANLPHLSEVFAFYVNAGDEEASVRARDIVSRICQTNAGQLERFGHINYIVDRQKAGGTLAIGGHIPLRSGSGVFGCGAIVRWLKIMPRLSILYLSSMTHLNDTDWELDPEVAAAVQSGKLRRTWAPLTDGKGSVLENLRQINFFESPSNVEEYMADFVKPFGKVELVTFPENIVLDKVDDVDDAVCTPKIKSMFPNAVILPRRIRFCLSSLLDLHDMYGAPGENAKKREGVLRKMSNAIHNAALRRLQSISLLVEGCDLHALSRLEILPAFESVLKTLADATNSRLELVVILSDRLDWKYLRGVLQYWAASKKLKPRTRSGGVFVKLIGRDNLFFHDNNESVVDEVDYDVDEDAYTPEAPPSDDEADAVEGANPPAVRNEDVRDDIPTLNVDRVRECLQTLWKSLDVEHQKELIIDNYTDAYYVDFAKRRLPWLLTLFENDAENENESVSGGGEEDDYGLDDDDYLYDDADAEFYQDYDVGDGDEEGENM